MGDMKLDISRQKQYGVALKLTPELKQALLAAQQNGQAMSMTFGRDSAPNVIQMGGTSFSFTRAEEGLDARIIHQGHANNHDAAEIAMIQQKLSIQRDLSKDVSERIRANREEAENARKGRTLQKLIDAPAATAGVKQVIAIPRQEASRPKSKSRPASAVLPRQSGQPAATSQAAAAAARPATPPPAASGSLSAETQAVMQAQGLPYIAPAGGKGRGKPKPGKGQIQKRLAQHQKSVGGSANVQAKIQGLRLCLMMIILERARKTAAVINMVQQIGNLVPKLRHPQKEEIKAALESVGENRSPGFWYVTDRLKEEAEAFRTAFEAGAALTQWERGPQQHGIASAIASQAVAGDGIPIRAGTPPAPEAQPARAEPTAQLATVSAQEGTSGTITQSQPSAPGTAQQLSLTGTLAKPLLMEADQKPKKKHKKRRREASQAMDAGPPGSPQAHASAAPDDPDDSSRSKRMHQSDPTTAALDLAAPLTSHMEQPLSCPTPSLPPLQDDRAPCDDFVGANGQVPPLENGNGQLHDETGSEASEQQQPLSPEPELDKYDHEQPIDPGPVSSRDQYLERTQYYYDKFEVYHMLDLRIRSFSEELQSLHQAASQHGEDLQQWAKVAKKLERQELPKVKRWDHILKIMHEELRIEAEQLQYFLRTFSRGDGDGTEAFSMLGITFMA
ncbi:hypothetical protein WJX74_003445 [Apatococcus lobatus]|uniref:Uncharacterized protein n=1 Tax=Apatococcus lobatus TaxID=904363 RepID=A0AAW1QWW4_9CHLO